MQSRHTNSESTPEPRPPLCSCGHSLEEHGTAERTDPGTGRILRVPGACFAKTGPGHVHRERVQTCKLTAHVHDQRLCGKVCLTKEHVHGDACFEDYEQQVPETCKCIGYDTRSEAARRHERWRDETRCAWCAHPESDHLRDDGLRPCRKMLEGMNPVRQRCHECRGYVPVSEFRQNPSAYSRPDTAARR